MHDQFLLRVNLEWSNVEKNRLQNEHTQQDLFKEYVQMIIWMNVGKFLNRNWGNSTNYTNYINIINDYMCISITQLNVYQWKDPLVKMLYVAAYYDKTQWQNIHSRLT